MNEVPQDKNSSIITANLGPNFLPFPICENGSLLHQVEAGALETCLLWRVEITFLLIAATPIFLRH